MTEPREERRLRGYVRAMRIVVPISAVLWAAAILTFAAYPIIFWSLALPNVVVTILMIWLDARIVSLGGEPYWKRRRGDGS
jgi:hypothetical protein